MHHLGPFLTRDTCFTLLTGASLFLHSGAFGETVPVPEFLGLTYDAANRTAEQAEIALIVAREDSNQQRDTVIGQLPEAGALLGAERRVRLVVSDGLVLPDLAGLLRGEAEAELAGLGLFAETTLRPIREAGAISAGQVGLTVPRAGTRMDATRQLVFLVVAEIGTFTLPDSLIGMNHSVARRLLEDQLLEVSFDQSIASNYRVDACGRWTEYTYTVRSVSPAPGSVVLAGDHVQLWLNVLSKEHPDPCNDDGVIH